MRTVARLNVTPVKGTRLLHPDRLRLRPAGLPENRLFFIVDEVGELFSGGDVGALMQVRSAWDAGRDILALRFPDGRDLEGSGSELGEALTTDFYGRRVPGRIVEGPFAEALSAFVGQPVRLVRCDRPGDAFDVEPLTLVSWASVRDLGEHGGRGDLDARRFRMNLELDGCEPFEEDTWGGRDVRVGGAVIRVGAQVPRCVVTTLDPATGAKDFATLTQIARHRPRIDGGGGLPFGMYAEVVEPGEIAVGDPVEPLPA